MKSTAKIHLLGNVDSRQVSGCQLYLIHLQVRTFDKFKWQVTVSRGSGRFIKTEL